MGLFEAVESARDDLRTWLEENPDVAFEPHDEIFQIADSATPVYTRESLEFAMEEMEFVFAEPDIGSDGTALGIINANIFEYIAGMLWEYYYEWEREHAEKVSLLHDLEDE